MHYSKILSKFGSVRYKLRDEKFVELMILWPNVIDGKNNAGIFKKIVAS